VIAITLPCSFLLSPHLRVCLHTHTHSVSTTTSSYVLQSKRNHTFIPNSLTHTPHLESARCWLVTPPSLPLCPPCYCERTLAEWWRDAAEGSKVWPTGCTRKKIHLKLILVKKFTCAPFCSIKSRTRARGGEQPPKSGWPYGSPSSKKKPFVENKTSFLKSNNYSLTIDWLRLIWDRMSWLRWAQVATTWFGQNVRIEKRHPNWIKTSDLEKDVHSEKRSPTRDKTIFGRIFHKFSTKPSFCLQSAGPFVHHNGARRLRRDAPRRPKPSPQRAPWLWDTVMFLGLGLAINCRKLFLSVRTPEPSHTTRCATGGVLGFWSSVKLGSTLASFSRGHRRHLIQFVRELHASAAYCDGFTH